MATGAQRFVATGTVGVGGRADRVAAAALRAFVCGLGRWWCRGGWCSMGAHTSGERTGG
jgi:hypothetical protein